MELNESVHEVLYANHVQEKYDSGNLLGERRLRKYQKSTNMFGIFMFFTKCQKYPLCLYSLDTY